MKRVFIFILIILTLITVGIFYMLHTSGKIQEKLLLADKLIAEYPDSSLSVIQSIKGVNRLSGENQALYSLLLTQIMFKKHIPIESDSLIRIAANYYNESSDSLRKAWSYFYYARICKNMHEEKHALGYYQKAATAAAVTQNYKLLDLIYNYWGLLLQEKKPYDDGIEKLQKSLQYSKLNKDTLGQIYTLNDLGWSYIWKEDYKQALLYLKKGVQFVLKIENKNQEPSLYHNIAVAYWKKGEYKLALKYINKSLSLNLDSVKSIPSYNLKANIFIKTLYNDSALYYINKVGIGNTYYSKANYYNQLSLLEEKDGNYKKALEYRNLYTTYLDSITSSKEDSEIIALQKKYDYSLVENDKNKAKEAQYKAEATALVIIIISIILGGILLFFYYKKQHAKEAQLKKANEIVKQMQTQLLIKAEELEMQQKTLQQTETMLKEALQKEVEEKTAVSSGQNEITTLEKRQNKQREAISQKQEKLKELIFKMNTIIKKIDSLNSYNELQLTKNKAEVILSPQELADLEQVIEWYYDGFASRLRKAYDQLSNDDIYLCCLLKINISSKNIVSLLNTNSDALKKRKTRLKNDKMKLSDTYKTLDEYLFSI